MTDIKCPNCEDGFVIVEEDGRRIRDACYHCANTGFISAEQHRRDRIEAMAANLASRTVNQIKQACNNDPDSEGWAFHASESMMTEHEYTTARVMAKADEFGKVLADLDNSNPQLISALLDCMVPEPVEEPVTLQIAVVEDDSSDDDVPF